MIQKSLALLKLNNTNRKNIQKIKINKKPNLFRDHQDS